MKYLLYVVLAGVLWFVMFVLKPFNFWVMMAFSTSLLSVISYLHYKDQFKKEYFSVKEIAIGIGSAALLYLIFFFGRYVLDTFGIIPDHANNINSVYANKEQLPEWVVAMLLFFPIGFGEEYFWRGYIQRRLAERHGKWIALIITVAFYTAVHIPTGNTILLLAAFLVGIYWGLIFIWRGNIVAAALSHMLWDPFIFVILPMN